MTGPRTIIYVGNFRHPFCTEVHLAGSLEAMGHRVIRVQEHTIDWPSVPDLADAEGAHMFMWTRTVPTDMADAKPVLDELRARGVPSVAYHLDLFLGLDREHQVRDQPFFACDLLVTPHRSDRWGEFGVNHLWLPPGVFHAETDPVPADRRRFPHDVVFVGSHPYPHAEWRPVRDALIGAFEREFGSRFTVWPKHRQPLRGRDLQSLYASAKVVIGDSCLAGRPEAEGYWSDRVPETLGRGGVLIHPNVGGDIGPDGVWYEHMEHLLTYEAGDPGEALSEAHRVLADPEFGRSVGDAGRALVLGRDTYIHRMESMLTAVEDQFSWREPPAKPVPPPSPAAPMRVTAKANRRWSAQFHPRSGEMEAVDRSVVDEVWTADDYRVPAGGFRGTVLDVGGNIGAFAVLAARAGATKVITVEPHPENRGRLAHHLTVNLNSQQAGRVIVVPNAVVGDALRTPVISLAGNGGGAHRDEDDPGAQTVPTIAFRRLLDQFGPIEFCKLDMEGGEYDAFTGVTANDLHTHVAHMAIEHHGPMMGSHLESLGRDGLHLERWGAMVALLADCGTVHIHGHPMVGGIIRWDRY